MDLIMTLGEIPGLIPTTGLVGQVRLATTGEVRTIMAGAWTTATAILTTVTTVHTQALAQDLAILPGILTTDMVVDSAMATPRRLL